MQCFFSPVREESFSENIFADAIMNHGAEFCSTFAVEYRSHFTTDEGTRESFSLKRNTLIVLESGREKWISISQEKYLGEFLCNPERRIPCLHEWSDI